MAEPTPVSPGKATKRPQLTSGMRSNSYLSDHQQLRKPRLPDPHQSIDTVVESQAPHRSSPKPALSFRGIPSDDSPPVIVESGVNHGFSHHNCASEAGASVDRLVVTLFYKGASEKTNGSHGAPASASASPSKSTLADSSESLPANMAPTTNMDSFPLEPPTQDSEKLDHLYGSYVSPLCITSFLHLMSTFPLPEGTEEPNSSHRCMDNSEHPRVVELTLTPAPSSKYLSLGELRKHEMIYRFEQEWNVDVVLQKETVWRRNPRLVVFDMDSTLITQEVIDLLADAVTEPADLGARVSEITHRAMMGEIEFEASFRERLALLKGLPESIFDQLQPVLTITPGIPELVKAFKRLGIKTAVLSGGFYPLTTWLANKVGIDYAYANEVVFADGKLTGEAKGTIVGRERKRDLLLEIAAKEKIDLSQVVAVGDGANDLLMMDKANLGVAWNAKPRVQMEAAARLNGTSLLDLLFLFGYTSDEIHDLIA
jgi:phosphoserine phosphatase